MAKGKNYKIRWCVLPACIFEFDGNGWLFNNKIEAKKWIKNCGAGDLRIVKLRERRPTK